MSKALRSQICACALSALIFIGGIDAANDDPEATFEANKKTHLRFARLLARQPLPPYLWYDSCTGRARGVVEKLLQRLSVDSSYQIEYRDIEYQSNLQALRYRALLADELDLYYSSAHLRDDPKLSAGRSAIFQAQRIVVVPKRLSAITQLEQLKHLHGAFNGDDGSRQAVHLRNRGLTAKGLPSVIELVSQLKAGEVDYIISEKRITQYLLKKFQLHPNFIVSDIALETVDIVFYVRHNHPQGEEFLRQSDQFLNHYRQNGLMETLIFSQLQQWFHSDKSCLQRQHSENEK